MEAYQYSIGKPIGEFRRKFGLKQERLAKGLCTVNELSMIENGKHEPSIFLILLLFQRMGLHASKYGIVYSKKEWNKWIEMQCLLEWRQEGNIREWKKWLHCHQKKTSQKAYQAQFIWYLDLIGRKEREKALIKEAFRILQLTIPDFCLNEAGQYEYTRMERALLAYIAEKQYQMGQQEEGIDLFYTLLKNMEEKIRDEEEFFYGYPELVYLLFEKPQAREKYDSSLFYQKALAILKKGLGLDGILTLLKSRMEVWKHESGKISEKEQLVWEERIAALEVLELEEELEGSFGEEIFYRMTSGSLQGISLEKLLQTIRLELGMTKVSFCDGIYDERQYGRIERGESKPHSDKFQALMKKAGKEGYRFYPAIVSEEVEMHLLYQAMERDILSLRYSEAEEKLVLLEAGLDQTELINKQALQFNRNMLDMRFGKIDAAQKKKRYWELLRLTIPEHRDWREYPLKHIEIRLLNGIAIAETELGNYEEALRIITALKKNCEENPLFPLSDKRDYLVVLYNHVWILENQLNHIQAEKLAGEYAKIAGKFGFSYGFISLVYMELWNHGQVLEQEGGSKEEVWKRYGDRFRQFILAAEALGEEKEVAVIRNKCREYYGKEI